MLNFAFLKQVVSEYLKKIKANCVNAFSAQAAFFVILAFFPFVMAMLTLIQYLPVSASDVSSIIAGILPETLVDAVNSLVNEVFTKSTGTIFSITVITTIWSAGKGMLALIRGLNAVYEIDETRNYFKLRLISAVYTLALILILLIMIIFLGFGNRLFEFFISKLPKIVNLAYLIMSLRTALSLILLIGFFVLLFSVLPNRKTTPKKELPGAVISACGWILFTYIYEMYIDRVGTHSYLFGSITAALLLMLWLYICMYILFVGAQINSFLYNTHTGEEFRALLDSPVKRKK